MSFFRGTGTGPMFLGPGDTYTFLATTAETDGAYFVLEGLVPPDAGPPPHIHHDQVETFYIVEGQLEVMVDGQVREAKAGDFLHVSKGSPHSFINRSRASAKIIATFVPAGNAERFFREALEETTDRNAIPPSLDDAMIQRMMAAAERNGVELLPPPQG